MRFLCGEITCYLFNEKAVYTADKTIFGSLVVAGRLRPGTLRLRLPDAGSHGQRRGGHRDRRRGLFGACCYDDVVA